MVGAAECWGLIILKSSSLLKPMPSNPRSKISQNINNQSSVSPVNITTVAWGWFTGEWKCWVMGTFASPWPGTSNKDHAGPWHEGEQGTRAGVDWVCQSPQQHSWNQSLEEFPTKSVKTCNFPQVFPCSGLRAALPAAGRKQQHCCCHFTVWHKVKDNRVYKKLCSLFLKIRWKQARQMKTKA